MRFTIRDITKVMRATSGRLFGRVSAGTGKGEELTPSQVRSLISVYSTAEVDAIIGGLTFLTSSQIDTLAEINAILGDADLASISYVDSGLSGKQATLVSGTNIKTVNGTSLLGSGDVAVSASPAGSSGQVQFNSAGSFGGAAAVVYAATGTHIVVTSQVATIVPFCIKGAASQTSNLQEWQNSAGTVLSRVTSAGAVQCVSLTTGYGVGLILGDSYASLAVSGGQITVRAINVDSLLITSNGLGFRSDAILRWTSGILSAGADVGLSRHASGTLELNNGTPGTFRDLVVRNFRMASPTVPASASATGSAGQIAWDADFIYVCTATNTWKRVAIATW